MAGTDQGEPGDEQAFSTGSQAEATEAEGPHCAQAPPMGMPVPSTITRRRSTAGRGHQSRRRPSKSRRSRKAKGTSVAAKPGTAWADGWSSVVLQQQVQTAAVRELQDAF